MPDYSTRTLRMTVQRIDVIHCFLAVIHLELRNKNLYSKASEVNWRKSYWKKKPRIIVSVKFYLQ